MVLPDDTARRTKKVKQLKKGKMVKVAVAADLAHKARAHAAMLGGYGATVTVEAALIEYFKKPARRLQL